MKAMKLTRKLLPPLALVGALALVPVTTSSLAAADSANYQELETFMSVYERVKAQYVDQVDDHTLIKGAIDGMLASLDPHSSFVEATDFDVLKATTDGNYGGLGITVSVEDGAVKVVSPMEDTPAWRGGLKAGDYITHINGERPSGPRQAVRRRSRARAHRASPGEVGNQGRHRHHQHQFVRREHGRRHQGGSAGDRQGDRRQAARLRRRSAL